MLNLDMLSFEKQITYSLACLKSTGYVTFLSKQPVIWRNVDLKCW